jgi:hypothetical protein
MRFLNHVLFSATTALVVIGCGQEQAAPSVQETAAAKYKSGAPAPPAARAPMAGEGVAVKVIDGSVSTTITRGMMGAMGTALQAPAAAALSRKIIYDGEIDLIVKDVDPVAKKVVTIIQDARGYIAEQSTTGSPGSQRSTRWKLRIPVEQFELVVEKVVALGELERNTRTSQDVTEQYYDIEARIKNKKAEEKSLTKILDERTGKLEDILKIETELSRVRGEIEQFEGKIRVLDNLSSLATLTVNVREREKFEPPPPTVADFPTQVARTWENSVHALVDLCKAVILWSVNWAIWIPLIIVEALVAFILLRWLIRLTIRYLPRLIALAQTPITKPRAQ